MEKDTVQLLKKVLPLVGSLVGLALLDASKKTGGKRKTALTVAGALASTPFAVSYTKRLVKDVTNK